MEQRKRLTIGVEMAAKPELLLFLDEPTSGLDSQTSWNILQLLRKLTNHGQAILCTIHQPSAILFENFDRLLFLARGGKTVYFGEVGPGSQILIDYFEENGATPYPKGENPAEWMLAAIGASPGSHTDVDWHRTWLESPERARVREELESIERSGLNCPDSKANSESIYAEFAAPLTTQLRVVCRRVLQQYWRTPAYIWSKFLLSICTVRLLFFYWTILRAERRRVCSSDSRFSRPTHRSRASRTSCSQLSLWAPSVFLFAKPADTHFSAASDVHHLQPASAADHAELRHSAEPLRVP